MTGKRREKKQHSQVCSWKMYVRCYICMTSFNNLLILLLCLIYLLLLKLRTVKCNKITLIEYRVSYNKYIIKNKLIVSHFIIFHIKNRNKIRITSSLYFIEHNSIYDDILFLIPLYSIIINTQLIVICSEEVRVSRSIKFFSKIKNYTIYNGCIYFNIIFLRYMQLHSDLFRFCKFLNVYDILQNNRHNYANENERICKTFKYSQNYSIVTTVYRRYNLKQQVNVFLNQTLPPKYIIVVHDRNIVKVLSQNLDIIYYHTINFQAGYYFRYLVSILSPENQVIIYDDDWFPYNKSSHSKWINEINSEGSGLYAHHSASKNGIRWCATPLIIHRKWLFLMWFNDIYEKRSAEDGHLSFSLLLLCNIKCKTKEIYGLNYKSDSFSSSRINISKLFWSYYTSNISIKINSSYISHIKHKYNIY